MEEKTKLAINVIVKGAALVARAYCFYIDHENEIKEIIKPFIDACIKITESSKAIDAN